MRLPISGRRRRPVFERPRAAGPSLVRSGRGRMGSTVRLLVAALLIFGGLLAGVEAEITNRIVAVVNNEIITWLELEKKMGEILPPGTPAGNPELQKRILFQLIDEKLLGSQIRKLNLQVGRKRSTRPSAGSGRNRG